LVIRIGNVIRGCIYGALGLEAIRLLRGLGGSNRDQLELWTARILDWPLGVLVVGSVAVIVTVYGITELVQALRGDPDTRIDWSLIRLDIRPILQRISRFGVGIRGMLVATLGIFLARAALTHDPNQAAGPRESLLQLGGLFEGRWFLAVIAAGVVAYAIDQAIHARCRRIRPVL
jgi:hypothetical protein